LTQNVPNAVPTRKWQTVRIEITNVSGGVRLSLYLSGVPIASETDYGSGGAPITGADGILLRADATDANIQGLTIAPL
jgi:hypothetical protein